MRVRTDRSSGSRIAALALGASISTFSLVPGPLQGAAVVNSSQVTVTTEIVHQTIPEKPSALSRVPTARLEVSGDARYVAPLRSYLNELFEKAQRPMITQGVDNEYTIQVEISGAPSIDEITKSGGGVKGDALGKIVGGLGGVLKKAAPQLAFLDIQNTNIFCVVKCEVDMLFLDRAGHQIFQSAGRLTQTNNLKALGLELAGMDVTGQSVGGDAANFGQKLTKESAQQGLVNLAAYSASTNLLLKADPIFIAATNSPPQPVAVTPALPQSVPTLVSQGAPPSTPPPTTPGAASQDDWLTPEEAAKIMKVSVADILAAVDKGEIKIRRFGSQIRINRKSLE